MIITKTNNSINCNCLLMYKYDYGGLFLLALVETDSSNL